MTELALKDINNFHVVASTPAGMQAAQDQLVAWAEGKIIAEKDDMAESERALIEARGAGLRQEPFKRRIAKHKQRMTYLRKVAAALKAGYYIVPPFPAQVFAIRTDAKTPRKGQTTNRWDSITQNAKTLPEGEGRYVSPNPEVWQRTISHRNKEGALVETPQYYAQEFNEVDFPFAMVKPEVIEATRHALQSRVFDEIAALPYFRTKGDPIIVGRIKDGSRPHKEPLTFFITWWLDANDL